MAIPDEIRLENDGGNRHKSKETKELSKKTDVHSETDEKTTQSKTDQFTVISETVHIAIRSKTEQPMILPKTDNISIQSNTDQNMILSKTDHFVVQSNTDQNVVRVSVENIKEEFHPPKEKLGKESKNTSELKTKEHTRQRTISFAHYIDEEDRDTLKKSITKADRILHCTEYSERGQSKMVTRCPVYLSLTMICTFKTIISTMLTSVFRAILGKVKQKMWRLRVKTGEQKVSELQKEKVKQNIQWRMLDLQYNIRYHVISFFSRICNVSIKYKFSISDLFQNIGDAISKIPRFYSIFPAHTLQEYYQEVDANPNMSESERMKYDMLRVSTFSDFPRHCPVSTLRLAKSGFHYQGNGDEVVCFKCGVKYSNWQCLDDPILVHRRISPECTFIQSIDSSERSTENPQSDIQLYSRQGEDPNISSRASSHQNASSSSANGVSGGNQSSQGNPHHGIVEGMSNLSVESHLGRDQRNAPLATNAHNSPRSRQNSGNIAQDDRHFEHSSSQRSSNHNATFHTLDQERPLPTGNLPRSSQLDRIPGQIQPPAANGTPFRSQEGQIPGEIQRNDPQGMSSSVGYATSISSNPTNFTSSTRETNGAESALEPLGISIQRPRYPQFAILANRISSYAAWSAALHQKPDELAKAGFVYEGTHDCTRCFFCAGGLRDWERDDNPWIEHARWYPKCTFLLQCRGEDFVNLVQQGKIEDAHRKLGDRRPDAATVQRQVQDTMQSPAVIGVLEMGYTKECVQHAVEALHKTKDVGILSAEIILQAIWDLEENPTMGNNNSTENKSNSGALSNKEEDLTVSTRELLEENRQLKEQHTCKICMDEEIKIVFLPCGHMATCVNCAPAVRKCPLCRKFIKGTVKVIMS